MMTGSTRLQWHRLQLIITSNRAVDEWLSLFDDSILAERSLAPHRVQADQ